jgi:hypothetical protein
MTRSSISSIVGIMALLMFTGCDSNETAECQQLSENTYTASQPVLETLSDDRISLFELQQKVRTYESGSCEIPAEGLSELSLVIRNLTSCELSFDYRMSVIEDGEGSTVEGESSINPGAVDDQGVILRNSGVRIDEAQIILTPSNITQESCG